MNVKLAYEAELVARGYVSDPAQLRAVDALQRCADDWAAFKIQRSNAFIKIIQTQSDQYSIFLLGDLTSTIYPKIES